MGCIVVLPEHEARKIAAGEVVERPASVVKELLENALDAEATEITLSCYDGGKKRIRIIDNGCGMSPEDALLSIEHHATSKIKSVDELTTISTFGFRGEALSSIASVSIMRITTRRKEDECGYEVVMRCGVIEKHGSVAAAVGTTILIENLFDNVPARRKFLKQRDTEWRAIQQLVTAYALAFPVVGFTLYHDDQLIYTLSRVDTLLQRAENVFPSDTAVRFVPCDAEVGAVRIHGLVTSHEVTRYDRKSIFCFVNQRWVKNHILGKAIIAGYEGMLPPNKYPVAVLSVTLPKEQVDINVHPRKEEVLLMHPHIMSSAIEQAVRESLSCRVARLVAPRQIHAAFIAPPINTLEVFEPIVTPKKFESTYAFYQSNTPEIDIPTHESVFTQPSEAVPVVLHEIKPFAQETIAPVHLGNVLGQLHATYLLLESSEGLMILDQHAAHEAILYDRLQRRLDSGVPTTLLFPECVLYDVADNVHAQHVVAYLNELGIAGEMWGVSHILITATPAYLQGISLTDLVHSLFQKIPQNSRDLYHDIYAMIACKKAVKAGDTLSSEEMQNLVSAFMATERRLHCPHGRPTSWLVSVHDLEKCFQRK